MLLQSMFKTGLDTFENDFLACLEFLKFFVFFWKYSKTRPSMKHWANFFSKKLLRNTFGHSGTILDTFGTLNYFWFFSSIISKSQKVSPENWTQIFQVRKTELMFLGSGIWTRNFRPRISEMELRTLTVAWMQKKCLLSIVS